MPEVLQPYPGIRPFDEPDWPVFFGRDRQTSELLHKLETNRFVAVVGSSGSGKSSLVRAGLLRLLCQGFLMDATEWIFLVVRPGADPFASLATEIYRRHRDLGPGVDLEPVDQVSASLLAAELRRTDVELSGALARFGWPPETHFLLVVDQFEELFGFRATSRPEAAKRDDAERFVGLLMRTAARPVPRPFAPPAFAASPRLEIPDASPNPGPPSAETAVPTRDGAERLWVLLTMRSDFIGNCEIFPALAQAVSGSQFLVPVLDCAQKEEAIVRPGRTREIEGAAYPPFDFEEGLVNRIVNEAGDRLDQLPLMQHALMRAWKIASTRPSPDGAPTRVTQKDYELAGRIDRALHEHAEAAWEGVQKDARRAALTRTLFLALCCDSPEGKLVRRRPKVSEIATLSDASVAEIAEVVRLFQSDDRNFLLPSLVASPPHTLAADDVLDISHEALLRQWGRYLGWQLDEQRRVAELVRLRDRARLYQQNDEELLVGRALERAHEWRRSVTAAWAARHVDPSNWEAILAFIENSGMQALRYEEAQASQAQAERDREHREVRRNGRIVAVSAILVALAGLVALLIGRDARAKSTRAEQAEIGASNAFVAAWTARFEATRAVEQLAERQREAEDQQTLAFTRIIGSSGDELASPVERTTLWELAELTPASERIREKLLDAWFADFDSFFRASVPADRGLATAVGLSESRIVRVEQLAEELIGSALADPSKSPQSPEAWVNIAGWLSSNGALRVSAQLLESLEFSPESDTATFQARSAALATLVERLPPPDAVSLAKDTADALLRSLESSPPTEASETLSPARTLLRLSTELGREDASELLNRATAALLQHLSATEDSNQRRSAVLGQNLRQLAAGSGPEGNASLALRMMSWLETAPTNRPVWSPSLAAGIRDATARSAPEAAPTLLAALFRLVELRRDLLFGADAALCSAMATLSDSLRPGTAPASELISRIGNLVQGTTASGVRLPEATSAAGATNAAPPSTTANGLGLPEVTFATLAAIQIPFATPEFRSSLVDYLARLIPRAPGFSSGYAFGGEHLVLQRLAVKLTPDEALEGHGSPPS